VYILGLVNSTNRYKISVDCPITQCLQYISRVNLDDPDGQCQSHKTGILCSQCMEGYSVVFRSYQCRKCTNLYLLFTLYLLLTGIFLIVVLFLLNLTVTQGIVTGTILYVNIVWNNGMFLHLKERLVTFLHFYISIANLGSPSEICSYKGMNEYTKRLITNYLSALFAINCCFVYLWRSLLYQTLSAYI